MLAPYKSFLRRKTTRTPEFLNFFQDNIQGRRERRKEEREESEGRKERENKDVRKQDKEKKKRPLKQAHGTLRYRNYWVYNFK